MYTDRDYYFIDYILNNIPQHLFWKDKNLVFQGCNKQFAKQFGFDDPKDVIGKTDFDFPWSSKLRNKYVKDDKEILATGRAKLDYEEEQKQADGTTKIVLVSKVPIFDEDGKIAGILGIYSDITDRKRAEEFKQKAEAAKKVVNFSNLVAGSIAHELKNPLAGIRMQMEVLRTLNLEKMQPKEASPIIDDVTSAIIKTVDDTNYFINGMLKKVRTFATGEAHHTAFDQLSITADVEDLLATYPFTKNEQDLVKTAFTIRFKYLGDKILTGHVLSNLMKNALHAIAQTDKEDATITIETKEDPSGKFNLLIFRDTATGIPADFVEKIFDQFETKKDVHGGTGLGLAFCKAVMKDNYGGDITCTSKEGKFTEFVLKFPKI